MELIKKIMKEYDIKYTIYVDIKNDVFAEFGSISECNNIDLHRMIFYDIEQVKNIVNDETTIFPRFWSQGETRAAVSKASDSIIGVFFYDDDRDVLTAYNHIKVIDTKFKEYVAEIEWYYVNKMDTIN